MNIFARLDGYNLHPEYLMSANFVKRTPELVDPEDNVENVSHKVKMLESVIVNLVNKVGEETKALREDSKAMRAELKALKPTFSDLFKNRENDIQPSGSKSNISQPTIIEPIQPAGRKESFHPLGRDNLERRPK